MTRARGSVAGKVAFVTGAGQGIGRGIAERLHADGFMVSIADFNDESAAELAASLGGRDNGAVAVHVDVSDRQSVIAAVDETIEIFGDLHVVLNNAGVAPRIPIDEATPEDFARITSINIGGVLWGIQAAANAFERLGHGGKILNATSQAGHLGSPGISVYSASKFAVRGLTQAAARELGARGITVNAWAPGIVDTPMVQAIINDEIAETGESYEQAVRERLDTITLGRFSTIADVANVVSFLAGPDSDYITGQSIIADGGMVFN